MSTTLDDLYERDFYSWTQRQAAALRKAAGERINTSEPIDWENVAEEIECMGKEQASKLRSSYRVLARSSAEMALPARAALAELAQHDHPRARQCRGASSGKSRPKILQHRAFHHGL